MSRDTRHARPAAWQQAREYRRLFASQITMVSGSAQIVAQFFAGGNPPALPIRSSIHVRAGMYLFRDSPAAYYAYSIDLLINADPSQAIKARRSFFSRQNNVAGYTVDEIAVPADNTNVTLFSGLDASLWIRADSTVGGSAENQIQEIGMSYTGGFYSPSPTTNVAHLIVDEPCRPIY